MKNEYKIVIGAIIIILLVLVGAFALGGSNNASPTVTPTVSPTTNPSPMPTTSPVPTAVPSATIEATSATPTPSPSGSGDIIQTEYGYVITKATLGPQKWTNPTPKPTLPTPVLVSPPDDTEFMNPTEPPTLTWLPVPGATKYRVEYQWWNRDISDWQPFLVDEVASPSYTFSYKPAGGRWRVTALDGVGGASLPSGWWTFTSVSS